ncbi:hypothetical protein OG548_31495 [Streptomyces sp. NBC_01356]|uniref:hypothetical protein n=1 Tax=Streptomyces sp. NBC_01356 TaxID=2903836 RepID=UPI002E30F596|nr:hypothetical protein [Streptomyces sp. NBC_01356]
MANGRGRVRLWAVAVAVVTLTACGAGWAVSAQGGTSRPGVAVSTATPATRDEMIRNWTRLLAKQSQELPDTSDMSTEEIRAGWERDRLKYLKYAEPAEMPVVHACTGVKSLFDPDCW